MAAGQAFRVMLRMQIKPGMAEEFEQVWRDRVARLDAIFGEDVPPPTQPDTNPIHPHS